MSSYYFISNNDEKHWWRPKLHDGLNTIVEPSCTVIDEQIGGLMIWSVNSLNYQNGVWIRQAEVKFNDDELEAIKAKTHIKANKIYLKEKYSLFDLKTYEKFGLDIKQNPYILGYAIALGKLDFLNMIVEKGIMLSFNNIINWDVENKVWCDISKYKKGDMWNYVNPLDIAVQKWDFKVLEWANKYGQQYGITTSSGVSVGKPL